MILKHPLRSLENFMKLTFNFIIVKVRARIDEPI
jgi:hypothetical protein